MNELLTVLRSLGLPLAYNHFAEGEAPAPPFLVYLVSGSDNLFADDTVFLKVHRVVIELYTERKSPEIEARLENALADFCWQKDETYIDTERLYQISYEIEV